MKAPATVVAQPSATRRRRLEITDELLAGITHRIVERFKPETIILFGSHAYGKPHLDSDLDLFVVMQSRERPVVRSRKVREVAEVDSVPMDVLVRTPDEVSRRLELGDPFIRDILEKGRVLYKHELDR